VDNCQGDKMKKLISGFSDSLLKSSLTVILFFSLVNCSQNKFKEMEQVPVEKASDENPSSGIPNNSNSTGSFGGNSNSPLGSNNNISFNPSTIGGSNNSSLAGGNSGNTGNTVINDSSVVGTSTCLKPKVALFSASQITTSSAVIGGSIEPNNHSSYYYFDYGASPSFGSNTAPISIGSSPGKQEKSAAVTSLKVNTKYYYRIVATNECGSSYSDTGTFTSGLNATSFDVRGTMSGSLSAYQVKVDMSFDTQDVTKKGGYYLFAIVNSTILVCVNGCTTGEWTKWTGSAGSAAWSFAGLKAPLSGSNDGSLRNIFNFSGDVTALGGLELYAGYGIGNTEAEAIADMVNFRSSKFSNGRYLKVTTVPYQYRSISINGPSNSSPGSLSNYNLNAYIYPDYRDYGQAGYFFVVAHDPSNNYVIYRFNSSKGVYEWVAWDKNVNSLSDKYYKYDSAIKNEVFNIIKGDVTPYKGWTVYVGYGLGSSASAAAQDLMNNGKLSAAWILN